VLRRIFNILVLIPIALVLLAFMVANRNPVLLSFDPTSRETPALSLTLPLFAIIFAALIIGIVFGGMIVWWRQGKHRKLARKEHRIVEELSAEVKQQKQRADEHDPEVPTQGSQARGLAKLSSI
jgi:uncharacterized integral membrane protein